MNALALLVLLSGAASAAVPAGLPADLTDIGVAAAVRGAVRAVAPGAPVGRVLSSGKPVYLNDHVTTGAGGGLQLLLRDQTTFTLGPNSDMVLDTFVYDPATGAGRVSARIVKGAFRFVTGKIARRDPANMKVALPVGTIGIRGTIVGGEVDGDRASVVLLGPGPDNDAQERRGGITVGNRYGSVDIDAGGWGTTLRRGFAPSVPRRLTLEQLGRVLDPLNPSRGASNGGGGRTEFNASATQASGEGAAAGGVVLQGTIADRNASQPDASSFAAQQSNVTYTTWGDVLGIASGTGGYDSSGSWTGCTSCSTSNTPASGSFQMKMNVDFGQRQITYTEVDLSGGITDTLYGYNTINYGPIASASPGAKATYTFSAADLSNNPSFAGSKVTFLSPNGQPGGAAAFQMHYDNSSYDEKADGATTAPLGPTVQGGG
jgi:FecR protein